MTKSNKIAGVTVQVGGDTKPLIDALKAPNKKIAELSAELKGVEKALKIDPSNMGLLEQKTTIVSDQVEQLAKKLRILKDNQDLVNTGFDKFGKEISPDAIRAYNSEVAITEANLNYVSKKLDSTTNEINELSGGFKSAADSAAEFDKSLNDVEEETKDVEKATKDAKKELAESKKGLKDVKDAAEDTSGGLTTLRIAFGNLVADGIRFAIDALEDFVKQGVDYASGLDEVQNVIDTIWGADSSAEIDAWGKSAMRSFGLAELSAKQYASTLGSMIDAMGVTGRENALMSTSLTQLAADYASFRDLKPQEAFDKIRSAISGETEAIKSLGVVMTVNNLVRYAQSKGIKKNYQDMTEAAKVTLRYNFLMDKSSKVLGDFARNTETYHNQQTILSEKTKELSGQFANHFLPALTETLKITNKYLEENGEELAILGGIVATIINGLNLLLKVLSAIPTPLLIMIGAITLAIKTYIEMKKALTPTESALKAMGKTMKAWEASSDGFIVKTLAIVAALSVLLFLIIALKEGTDRAAKSLESAGKAAGNFGNVNVNQAKNGYAGGTKNAKRGLAWVGEEGPELVQFRGGERVIPAKESAQIAAGTNNTDARVFYDYGTMNVTVNGIRELDELVDWWQNKRLRERAMGAGI